jgi:hypothetical protein
MLKPLFCTAVAALFSTPTIAPADQLRDIQLRRLLEPSQDELTQERNGRIYIYESLTNHDIQRAMDEQFDRIESMMFIRVPKTDASGNVQKDHSTGKALIEDDGC